MLRWAIAFFVVALIAALFGFAGIARQLQESLRSFSNCF